MLEKESYDLFKPSLLGRRLKGNGEGVLGKGVLGAREKRGAREGGVTNLK